MRSRTILGLALALAGCSSSVGLGGTLEAGVWGGDRANLIVTRDSARAEFDCASGWLDAPIELDGVGQFDVEGSYRFEAGPVDLPVPARWTGVVEPVAGGSVITLSVIVRHPNAPPVTLGPYHLTKGQRVTVGFCA